MFHEENHTNSLSGSVPMTSVECEKERPLVVSPYTVPSRGPYPFNQPKRYIVFVSCLCYFSVISPSLVATLRWERSQGVNFFEKNVL